MFWKHLSDVLKHLDRCFASYNTKFSSLAWALPHLLLHIKLCIILYFFTAQNFLAKHIHTYTCVYTHTHVHMRILMIPLSSLSFLSQLISISFLSELSETHTHVYIHIYLGKSTMLPQQELQVVHESDNNIHALSSLGHRQIVTMTLHNVFKLHR